jgi:predicted DNA-binding protein (UPF0251 family)
MASRSYSPVEECHDGATLHEEINRLPERLRAAVALCFLEGLTYEAAAQHLGVSTATVRGRVARARERLRHRLTARGVTVPTSLFVAGTASQAPTAIPASLAHSTIRIAFGFMTGKTASVLARGVLSSMLLNQLKGVDSTTTPGNRWFLSDVARCCRARRRPRTGRTRPRPRQDTRRGAGSWCQFANNPANGPISADRNGKGVRNG